MKHDVEFANFTVTTSDDKVLIDLFESIIAPAFLNEYVRESRFETSYLFNDTGIKSIVRRDKTDVIIYGRIIKNMLLEREQVYQEGELIENHQKMLSSPSSIFVITLSDHKVIYLRETSNAPGMEAFQNTIRAFAKKAREDLINDIAKSSKAGQEVDEVFYDPKLKRVTKKHMREIIKIPNIDIVPLPSQQTLGSFIDSFREINVIETKIISTNHELEYDDLISEIRAQKNELKADIGTLRFSSKDGLDRAKAAEQITSAASTGNTILRVEGTGKQGQEIRGNNENFKVTVPLQIPSTSSPDSVATTLVDAYDTLVEEEALRPAPVAVSLTRVGEIAANIARLFYNLL